MYGFVIAVRCLEEDWYQSVLKGQLLFLLMPLKLDVSSCTHINCLVYLRFFCGYSYNNTIQEFSLLMHANMQ